ncbi:hypothetical protein EVA_13837 [gut metagenome]|uniref:Uncharacterized protein n=1 Tax=gut metagenome TaxID=749906 RepID=J9G8H8_9ZZZZ
METIIKAAAVFGRVSKTRPYDFSIIISQRTFHDFPYNIIYS